MSNGGWQPPRPGGAPPPTSGPGAPAGGNFAPPGQSGHSSGAGGPFDPTQPVPLEPAAQPPSRSRGKVIAAAVGVAAIVGAGVFAFTRISGDSASGGAATPEEAGQQLVEAYGNEDVLGAIDLLLPGERETLRDPVSEFVDELRRLEVLSDDADLADIGGVDVEVTDSNVDADETNVDDIVNLRISIEGTATVDGEELPIGDLILDNVDTDPGELNTEGEDASVDLPITAVRQDGRWYVSLFYTAAEQARQGADLGDIPAPEDAVAPSGGDDPEDAFDAFIEGIEQLNVEAMIASLNPDEFEALQRYAPLFVADAQDAIDEAGVNISIDEPQYTVSGDGDTRSMTVSYIAGEITADSETVQFEFEDGCATFTSTDQSESINTCELAQQTPSMDDMFGDSADEVEDFVDTLGAAFEDYENPGIIVKQVDGGWYLSPMATGVDQMLAVMRALDRGELEDIGSEAQTVLDEVLGDVFSGPAFPDEFIEDDGIDIDDPVDTVPDLTVPDLTVPDLTVPDLTVPDFTIPDITIPDVSNPDVSSPDVTGPDGSVPGDGFQCYSEVTVADATACYDALVASGELTAADVPVFLLAPECGLAESFWSGDYYSLPDAEFAALATSSAPCFQQLVTAGTIDEFALPLELSNPECLQGRNWYNAFEDDAYYDELLACAYG